MGLFDNFFRNFDEDSFRRKMNNQLGYDPMYDEVVEFTKGDFKTKLVLKFNSDGLLVSHMATCEYFQSDVFKTLKQELHKAIEEENFEKASEIQKKINNIREADEQKPTL